MAGGAATSAFTAGLVPVAPDTSISTSPSSLASLLSQARLPPSLPPAPSDQLPAPRDTLLVIATNLGRVHLFLGGTVFLGSLKVGDAGTIRVAGADVVSLEDQNPAIDPEDLLDAGTRLWLVWGQSDADADGVTVRHGFFDLTKTLLEPHPDAGGPGLSHSALLAVPSSATSENLRLSSLASQLLTSAIKAFEGACSAWKDAREQGRRFISKVEDMGKAQDVVLEARYQLGMLLLSGRPNDALRDFLGTKNTERVSLTRHSRGTAAHTIGQALVKWESSMNAAILKLREAIYQTLVPTLERLMIIANDRRMRWYGDPL